MTAEKQPIPDEARCPECWGEPAEAGHNLSALGYFHDDRQAICTECGNRWTMGIPDGEVEPYFWHDLECRSCGDWGRVHRIHPNEEKNVVGLHMKCPTCYYVWFVQRVLGETDTAIVGWPMTTGELGDGHGWTNEEGGIRPNEPLPDYGGSVQEKAETITKLDKVKQ